MPALALDHARLHSPLTSPPWNLGGERETGVRAMAGVGLPEWGTTMPGAQFAAVWQQVRAPVVAPLLRLSVALCLVMTVMLFAEKVYMAVVVLAVRLLRRRPERMYRWEPMRDDLESGGGEHPMVLVQIPMYNEREVSLIKLHVDY
ncbi:hypothetical protein PR202_ga14902 [Eleusine coracana subsp. coracana]|uniref:Glycosyltransferase 2-like domain-containing protein n=1 Tax=Eleusine coracana subsp. coracana TaxID=191504 RepID=A0AAV5CIV5_ELECO|nr:hypothetical protein PR202_ga14902 [Eleusine coracana subsp. coracana]